MKMIAKAGIALLIVGMFPALIIHSIMGTKPEILSDFSIYFLAVWTAGALIAFIIVAAFFIIGLFKGD